MPRAVVLLAALLASPGFATECDCLWQGPFTAVQGETDLVVAGHVAALSGNSIDLAIDRVLRGKEFRERVRIWLDTGELCRATPGTFPAESGWVMALQRIEQVPPGGFNPHTPNISYGRVGDYSLSRCGGYWLRLSEDLVSGNLTGGPRWEMNPKMSPVLLDLVASHVAGDLDAKALEQAGRVDPELQRLMIDTRVFLRQERRALEAEQEVEESEDQVRSSGGSSSSSSSSILSESPQIQRPPK